MNEVFTLKNENTAQDLTPFVSSMTWSGSIDEGARKLDVVIAYNTMDKSFILPKIDVGDSLKLSYHTQETPDQEITIFLGRIFLMDRASRSYTMEIAAYDHMIYLVKSHESYNYSNMAARDVIARVCNVLGVTQGDLSCKDLDIKCNFIADNLSGTEIIKKALDTCSAATKNKYHAYLVYDKENKSLLNVVKGDTVIDYIVKDAKNETSGRHSASAENMVNQVQIVDKDGNTTGYLYNQEDKDKYGAIQAVYKIDDKKDNEKAARAVLKKLEETSSVSAIGDVTAIAGYAIKIKEEQIIGTFRISSDSHKIENNTHTMDLTLEYLEPVDAGKNATTQGTIPAYNPGTSTGAGSNNVDEGLDAGANAWLGATMDNGANGCAEAVGKVGSYYSPFLAQECNNGVVYVPTMVQDAGANCIPFDSSQLQKGDVIVYGDDDHVVIYDGAGGYIGNSSSQNEVIHGGDYTEMGGLYPTKIIKTSQA